MRVIGVTGGAGAGKSEVLSYIKKRYEACVIKADDIGCELMQPGHDCYERVRILFPTSELEDHTLDRKVIADIVFRDHRSLQKLDEIMHPAIKKEILHRIVQEEKRQTTYVFIEAALLLEENYDAFCDEIWYIYAGEHTRRQRLLQRGYREDRIRRTMEAQLLEHAFRQKCTMVIDNDGSLEKMKEQVDARMMKNETV